MCQYIYIKLQLSSLESLYNKQQKNSRISLRIVNGFHLQVKLTLSARPYCNIKMRNCPFVLQHQNETVSVRTAALIQCESPNESYNLED
jgi:hypothetical protein